MEELPLRYLYVCRRKRLIDLLKKWKRMGVPLGVYSDYPAKLKIEKLGINKIFDVIVTSTDNDVNAFKPKADGFINAARKLGIAPNEVVYIGDRKDVDGVGAEAAGMSYIILNDFQFDNTISSHLGLDLTKLDRRLRKIYGHPV